MAYKKKSKLEAMKELRDQIGEYTIASLIERKLFLIRDNNNEKPYQVIVDLVGDPKFDSRNNWPLSYECFEEVKSISSREKRGFQNFYKLREDYIEVYKKHMKS